MLKPHFSSSCGTDIWKLRFHWNIAPTYGVLRAIWQALARNPAC